MSREHPILGIVLPCYNEQEVFKYTAEKLSALMRRLINDGTIKEQSFIAFVDDGSKDETWKLISEENKNNKLVKGLKLAKNAGHQRALLSGLLTFKENADCLVSIDADLQDDINIIEDMVKAYVNGADIVYGVRKERNTDTFFKKQTAHFFYLLMAFMKVKVVYNHADYRLASKQVLDEFEHFKEYNLFLRGIFPLLGFNTTSIYYNRLERFAGESKYPLRKMLSFAWDGVTSFSSFPLRIVTTIGLVVFLISIGLSFYALISYFLHESVPGWTSIVLPMYFLGGVQLFCMGIIGEYIAKMYMEVKGRPRYIIEKKLD